MKMGIRHPSRGIDICLFAGSKKGIQLIKDALGLMDMHKRHI
jgi:hypothetical protein